MTMVKKKGKRKKTNAKAVEKDEKEVRREDLVRRATLLQQEWTDEIASKTAIEKQVKDLQVFWNMEKKSLEEQTFYYQSLVNKLEQIDDEHHSQIDVYKEKMKYLLYQNCNDIAQSKVDINFELKSIMDKYQVKLLDAYQGKIEQNKSLRQRQLLQREILTQLQIQRDQRCSSLQEEFRFKEKEVLLHSDRQLKELRVLMGNHAKDRLKSLTNDVAKDIMKRHEKEMDQIRRELRERAHLDFDKVQKLEEVTRIMKKRQRQTEKNISDLQNKNRNIKEPLARAEEEFTRLTKAQEEFTLQKETLDIQKSMLIIADKDLKDLEWKYEVLFQQCESLEKERDLYRNRFEGKTLKADRMSKYQSTMNVLSY